MSSFVSLVLQRGRVGAQRTLLAWPSSQKGFLYALAEPWWPKQKTCQVNRADKAIPPAANSVGKGSGTPCYCAEEWQTGSTSSYWWNRVWSWRALAANLKDLNFLLKAMGRHYRIFVLAKILLVASKRQKQLKVALTRRKGKGWLLVPKNDKNWESCKHSLIQGANNATSPGVLALLSWLCRLQAGPCPETPCGGSWEPHSCHSGAKRSVHFL